jgi:hypothetical protein
LRVDQRVHGIDDDRAHLAGGRIMFQDVVDDRDEVGQALAGARAGRYDKVLPLSRIIDSSALVAVQVQRPEVARVIGSAEDARAQRMEHARADQLLHGLRLLIGR